MRIAVMAPPWAPVPPRLYGGIELVVDLLARGYAAAGHDVVLYTTGDSTCPVERRWQVPQAEHNRIGSAVPELRHVIWAFDDARDFDVIHDHTVAGPIYAARYPDPPMVTTIHGELTDELVDIYQHSARRAGIIAISHHQRRVAPQVPIARVIHHGIEASQFPVGRGDGGYVLFLGRMAPDKGAHRAMEAAFKADVPLIMAAKMREAAEVSYYESDVLPYLNDRLMYEGEVDHARKLELLAGARALLFPIRWNEPFGLVMLEALACGTPVLAFPEGAAPEVIEDGRTGFLCHDEADMADAIGRVGGIDRGECRVAVEGYFSAERMVADHLTLFEELLGR
jgi:glycosyltransferase involved in cell wall biosynthesis